MVVGRRDRNLGQETMDDEIRAELAARYRPEIESLQDLIDRDLSAWLS